MKFAICQELYENWDWERQCRFSSEQGYTGLEVAPFSLADNISEISDSERSRLRKVAEDNGLQIIGLHWLLAKTEGFHLTAADPTIRRATSEYLKQLGELCCDLGGDLMVFGSPFQRNLEAGTTQEEGYERAAEVFRTAMPALAERNVRICMEPLTPKETNFVNTCADAVRLIEMVDHPLFVLHQDVKAMHGAESESIPELIHRYKNIVGHFHVNDTNLLGPGMGETDYRPILQALLETNYEGWVSVEVFDYSPGCELIASQSLENLRRVLSDLES
ncbi:MAG TPA: sugar phosphate isomerase/epimerase family protein [Planctomycetaceae bacterium]|nr:sugar phosphate isomerase/epimerase family protein [Planctomycetaceae bacterium]